MLRRTGPGTAARPGSRVQVATLDPFHGYKNAIDDQLADAISVLDKPSTGSGAARATRSTASGTCCAADFVDGLAAELISGIGQLGKLSMILVASRRPSARLVWW
jgi:hypothetical protein